MEAIPVRIVGSVHITQGFVLLGAVLLETAIAMVLLSRVLPYRANRWANIIVGVIQIVANVQSLTGPLYWNLLLCLFYSDRNCLFVVHCLVCLDVASA